MKNLKIIGLGFIIGLILLSGLMEQAAEAQPSKVPMGRSFSETQPKGACRIDPSITFTEEQTKELENLQSAYLEKAKPLWGEMRDLRLEVRFAVSDPQVQPQALLDKQRKFSALQARLENLLFSYQVKARAIFTKEQLERFPADCPLKMGTGYGVGRGLGKGPQKGIR
jgi:Spy/CpxP family protein refolding chaperone